MGAITITIADEDLPRTYEALSWYYGLKYPDEARQVPDELAKWMANVNQQYERFLNSQQADSDFQDGYVPPAIGGEDDLPSGGGRGSRSR